MHKTNVLQPLHTVQKIGTTVEYIKQIGKTVAHSLKNWHNRCTQSKKLAQPLHSVKKGRSLLETF